MSIVVKAADRMLTAVVPRATASATTCPSGCTRATCYCNTGNGFWYDHCVSPHGECRACFRTTHHC